MTNALTTLTKILAAKLDMGDGAGLIDTLKATAFKGQVSDAQMTALLVVANQYGLNPWTKEIYAFPDKNNGIVPVVGVDGWSRIINSHPQFDGMEFNQSSNMVRAIGAKSDAPEWIECVIYRKDRSKPVVIREYLDECYRAPFKNRDGYAVDGPWQTHPKRFLRHKSMIQCARLAFGYVGIYDQDEAERIVESGVKHMGDVEVVQKEAPPTWPDAAFEKQLPKFRDAIAKGKTPEEIIAWAETKGSLTDAQKAKLMAYTEATKSVSFAEVADKLNKATDRDALYLAADLINAVPEDQRGELNVIFALRETEIQE